MALNLPVIDSDGEVQDLSRADPSAFKSFNDLPESLQGKLRRLRGRPKAEETKERITIRLSREVVRRFRASGDGWQTRIDEALQEWLKKNTPA